MLLSQRLDEKTLWWFEHLRCGCGCNLVLLLTHAWDTVHSCHMHEFIIILCFRYRHTSWTCTVYLLGKCLSIPLSTNNCSFGSHCTKTPFLPVSQISTASQPEAHNWTSCRKWATHRTSYKLMRCKPSEARLKKCTYVYIFRRGIAASVSLIMWLVRYLGPDLNIDYRAAT